MGHNCSAIYMVVTTTILAYLPVQAVNAVLSDSCFSCAAVGSCDAKGTAEIGLHEERLLRNGNFQRIAFCPNGKYVAACAVTDKSDCCTFIFDVKNGREVAQIPGHGNGGLAFSGDGTCLATGRKDGQKTVCLWRSSTGTELAQFSLATDRPGNEGAWDLAFSPDQKTLAVGLIDATIRILDLVEKKELIKLESPPFTVCSVAFSPDGRFLASGSHHRSIRLWSTESWTQVASWYDASVNALAFSSDGRFLVTGSFDESVRVWTMPSRKQWRMLVGRLGAVRSVALTADGRTVVTLAADRNVRIWELATGQERGNVTTNLLQAASNAQSMAVSPDGSYLAIGGPDRLELRKLPPRLKASNESPNADSLKEMWEVLASGDAVAAYQAISLLASRPDEAIPMLRSFWRPSAGFDAAQAKQWINQLASSRFEERERASMELAKVADLMEDELRKAQRNVPAPEAQHRLGQILEQIQLGIPPSERLRWLRAVELLERIGSQKALDLLQTMASETTDALLASEANLSILRLRPPR